MRKPDPDMLRLTIGRAGGDTGHAVMVGDSMTDVATAKAAAVPVIAVDFGYTEIAPAELGADRLISHFDALPGVVMELVSIRT
jgi:phosphoglycolate phosphatase